MFVFAHMGIGKKIADPWIKSLPLVPFFVGTLLPDLIDKPLYYGLAWWTGKWAGELGLICGTRTFGHTAVLLLAFLLALRATPFAKALALGALTHCALDSAIGVARHWGSNSAIVAFAWPLLGPFEPSPFRDGGEHVLTILNPYVMVPEILGACLLYWDYRRKRSTEFPRGNSVE